MKKGLHHKRRTKKKQHSKAKQLNPQHRTINRHHPARANIKRKKPNWFGHKLMISHIEEEKRSKMNRHRARRNPKNSKKSSNQYQGEINEWINN